MQIETVSVNVEDKGKYKMAVLAYRENGQLKEKKLMSFGGSAPAFQVLSKSTPGQSYAISCVKNDKGFWDWTQATEGSAPAAATGGSTVANASPRSTYETPEERALKQALIVKQSSISSAIEYFKLNTKKVPTPNEVLDIARQFERFVFSKEEKAADNPFENMEDDVPL